MVRELVYMAYEDRQSKLDFSLEKRRLRWALRAVFHYLKGALGKMGL